MLLSDSRLKKLIETSPSALKDQEMKASEFMLNHEDSILDLSVGDIAEGAEVSKATVVRLCKRLGFNGLKEFKIYYQTGKNPKSKESEALTWTSSNKEAFRLMENLSVSVINQSMNAYNFHSMEIFASLIYQAKNIDILAVGGSVVVAEYLKIELQRLGKRVAVISDAYSLNNHHIPYSANDLIIAVSCSGESREIIDFLKNEQNKQITILAMTNNKDSRLGKLSHAILISEPKQTLDSDGNMLARLSMFSLINTLFVFIALLAGRNSTLFQENFSQDSNYKKINAKEISDVYRS